MLTIYALQIICSFATTRKHQNFAVIVTTLTLNFDTGYKMLTKVGVLRLCTLETDLSKVPRQLFQRKRNSKGIEYFEIHYTLTVTPTSALLLFNLELNGVSYGSVSSQY
jgi:hypothetical protein